MQMSKIMSNIKFLFKVLFYSILVLNITLLFFHSVGIGEIILPASNLSFKISIIVFALTILLIAFQLIKNIFKKEWRKLLLWMRISSKM